MPAFAYVWPGFWTVAEPPSPKSQAQVAMFPVEVSLKLTESGEKPDVGVPEKLAIGAYGDVRACQLIPSTFGNVRTATLAEIWARRDKEPVRRNGRWFCPAGDREFRTANPDSFPPEV